jgi:hypothetical protein
MKLPNFDFERDKLTFKQWKDGWNMGLCAHRIHLIADPKEDVSVVSELTAAVSNETLKWIANHHFSEEDQTNPEAVIRAFEDHIREQQTLR